MVTGGGQEIAHARKGSATLTQLCQGMAMEVTVRPLTEDDAAGLAAAIAASLEHLRPWMPWAVDEPRGLAFHLRRIRDGNAAEAAGGDKLRVMVAGGVIVGGCGLHRRVGPDGLEIGYWVHVAWTRRGIATEAVRQLAAEAFADPAIAFVEIHHDVANLASGAVAAAAGFTAIADRPRAPQAPAETGVGRIWRVTRGQTVSS
jgi:RimJ/RimL family protein N-acetyltransferase